MFTDLWGTIPHSHSATLDDASTFSKLERSKKAIELIQEKSKIKTQIEILQWTKKVVALLNLAEKNNDLDNPFIKVLIRAKNGDMDTYGIDLLLGELSHAIYSLEANNELNEQSAKYAHDAISRWAELELKDAV